MTDHPHPVWLPGDGFIDHRGRYYPEAAVRGAIQHVADWWSSLTDEDRIAFSYAAHLAAIGKEIDDAVFGDDR